MLMTYLYVNMLVNMLEFLCVQLRNNIWKIFLYFTLELILSVQLYHLSHCAYASLKEALKYVVYIYNPFSHRCNKANENNYFPNLVLDVMSEISFQE